MADSEKVSTEQPQQPPPSVAEAAAGNQPPKVPQAAKEVIGKYPVSTTHFRISYRLDFGLSARHFVLLHNHILLFCRTDFFCCSAFL